MSKSNSRRMEGAVKRLKDMEKLVSPYSEDVSIRRAPQRSKWITSDQMTMPADVREASCNKGAVT